MRGKCANDINIVLTYAWNEKVFKLKIIFGYLFETRFHYVAQVFGSLLLPPPNLILSHLIFTKAL